jgi:hypothetical protein
MPFFERALVDALGAQPGRPFSIRLLRVKARIASRDEDRLDSLNVQRATARRFTRTTAPNQP